MAEQGLRESRSEGARGFFKGRGFRAVLAAIALLCTIGAAILFVAFSILVSSSFNESNDMLLDSLTEIFNTSGAQYLNSSDLLARNAYDRAEMMTSALSKLVTPEGKYVGPRFFGDGVVVEVVDGKVVYPDVMPKGYVTVSKEELEENVSTGVALVKSFDFDQMLSVPSEDEAPQFVTAGDGAGATTGATGAKASTSSTSRISKKGLAYYFVMPIADGIYYLDVTTESELYEYAVSQNYAFMQLRVIEEAYNRGILVVGDANSGDEDLSLRSDSYHFKGIKSASELGFTQSDITGKRPLVFTTTGPYLCTYQQIPDQGLQLIYATPAQDLLMGSVASGVFMLVLLLLILIAFIAYLVEVPRYVTGRQLTSAQWSRYHPQEVRSNIIAAGIACALLVFVVGFLVQTLGSLRSEIISGRRIAASVFDGIEEGVSERDETVEKAEGEWYARYCTRLATLFSYYPELATDEKLREYARALEVDYLMVFDAEGNETACSKGYTGFVLGDGEDEANAQGLQRLLHGVTSVVCIKSNNSVTGSRGQLVGAAIRSNEGHGVSGVVVMSVPPERLSQASGESGVNEQLASVSPKGTVLFSADEETGVIKYASNPDMVGYTVSDRGLDDTSLRDGYMDFDTVNGSGYFVVTAKSGSDINYYSVNDSSTMKLAFIFGAISVLCFAIILPLVVWPLLKAYTTERYERETRLMDNEGVPDITMGSSDNGSVGPGKGARGTESIWTLIRRASLGDKTWAQRTPEEHVRYVTIFGLFVLVLLLLFYELVLSRSLYRDETPLLSFILHGDWMRGANIFAVCSIVIVFAAAFFAYTLLRRVLSLVSSFLDPKGKTVCRLLLSFARYLTYALVAYLSFSYLGFPASTIVGSLGLVGMAISLGSKDLVADVVAGIFIVFEDQFQVGDIIEVNGFRGVVKELGVRSTKIINENGNVKTVGNMDVKNVLNMTKYDSIIVQTLKLPIGGSLTKVEEVLGAELPLIAERCGKILSGPTYEGVSEIASGSITITISVSCKEQDSKEVLRYLNRELILLCERNGIPIK